ncbi:hypothetical protein T4B_12467 [Trichinella pseudospiralis]|uniref:Uncharacterized protein n=2 Tax=Trichinella pseudospiralis TaxID=6337 RepID=A0A0V1G1I1_TRIPS|nr:hypothetical protein T4E_5829 [Trichinella pseudospiralis]KRY72758.1 hypothetical protein T4A_1354 [Trichinella pseudospiralis]KRY92164.1 hypothetical protein T4D_2112 [Trichinella pseudospiralis]KRZ22983.1 hypothetical protein T4B_12467 [Trichinella pseudospiralis]KRZ31266.1 hypothetical protein T4C_3582 [Trichinella pseudospiralis]
MLYVSSNSDNNCQKGKVLFIRLTALSKVMTFSEGVEPVQERSVVRMLKTIEATRLKPGARVFFRSSASVSMCRSTSANIHLSIAEGLCMGQVQNVTAISAHSVLRNANYYMLVTNARPHHATPAAETEPLI